MSNSPCSWKMTTLFGAVLLLSIPIMPDRQVIVYVLITVAMWKMRFAKVPAGRKTRRPLSLFL
ncbi:hypothetical protein ACLBR5_28340 [Escherichia coli]